MKQHGIGAYWTLVQQCIKGGSAVNRTLALTLEREAEIAFLLMPGEEMPYWTKVQ
jgi:hypothetical protein